MKFDWLKRLLSFKFSITAKISVGFGIITLAVAVNVIVTLSMFSRNAEVNDQINQIYNPSVENLNTLAALVENSRGLIRSWVFIDKKPDAPDKLKLISLHENEFPKVDSLLLDLSEKWTFEDERETYSIISQTIKDTLFPKQKYIMDLLNSFESYNDPLVVFETQPMVLEGGEIITLTDKIIEQLSELTITQENRADATRSDMDQRFSRFSNFIILMGIALVVVSIIIAILTIRSLIVPINYIKGILLEMSKGILPDKEIKEGNDEIGEMAHAMNNVINGQKRISEFANEIGKGNFESDFEALSSEDTLGNSLLSMREELRNAAREEEKRKKEDEQRNWATQGQAMFAEILRKNNDNMEELSYNIISNLVKYIGANQGGLFQINNMNEEDIHIELMACYAFDRRKFMQKRIEMGEGLVGRCLQEKESIYMTDIPNDYINITSGMGGENPRSLLLVPLLVNEEEFGVIEIASFKEMQKYQIEFVEKIGESIASTISSVRTNIQTQLLLEQSRQQAEEMHSQEEEMRQNMEELRATQEQSARRESELQRALDETTARLRKYE